WQVFKTAFLSPILASLHSNNCQSIGCEPVCLSLFVDICDLATAFVDRDTFCTFCFRNFVLSTKQHKKWKRKKSGSSRDPQRDWGSFWQKNYCKRAIVW